MTMRIVALITCLASLALATDTIEVCRQGKEISIPIEELSPYDEVGGCNPYAYLQPSSPTPVDNIVINSNDEDVTLGQVMDDPIGNLSSTTRKAMSNDPTRASNGSMVNVNGSTPTNAMGVNGSKATEAMNVNGSTATKATNVSSDPSLSAKLSAASSQSPQLGAASSLSAQPGAASSLSAQPGAAPILSAQPGAAPILSAQPGAAPALSAQPGAAPSLSAQPSAAPCLSAQPGAAPCLSAQPSLTKSMNDSSAKPSNGSMTTPEDHDDARSRRASLDAHHWQAEGSFKHGHMYATGATQAPVDLDAADPKVRVLFYLQWFSNVSVFNKPDQVFLLYPKATPITTTNMRIN